MGFPPFGPWIAVVPRLLGRDYREGKPEYFRSLIETWVSKLILRYLDLI